MKLNKVVELPSGYIVVCRKVPPSATGDLIKSIKRPEYPMQEVRSEDGNVERLPALMDTPEFERYKANNAEYREACINAMHDFRLGYGIKGWKNVDDDKFRTGVPDEWEPDPVLAIAGIEVGDDEWSRWLAFIKYELIQTDDGLDAVMDAVSVRSVAAEDVKDAVDPTELNA